MVVPFSLPCYTHSFIILKTILFKKYKCVCSPYQGRETYRPLQVYYDVWGLGISNYEEKPCAMVFYSDFRNHAHVR